MLVDESREVRGMENRSNEQSTSNFTKNLSDDKHNCVNDKLENKGERWHNNNRQAENYAITSNDEIPTTINNNAIADHSDGVSSTSLLKDDEDYEDDESTTSSSDAEDEETPDAELADRGWLAETTPAGVYPHHQMNGVALPSVEPPNFGNVKVENSTNVHLGNRTFYKGPVTIKQIVYASNTTPVIENGFVQKIEGENGTVADVATDVGTTTADGSLTTIFERSTVGKGNRVKKLLWKYRYTIVIAVIIILVVLIAAIMLSGTHDSTYPIIPASPNDTSINNGVSFVSRQDWQAALPDGQRQCLKILPPSHVIIIHTVTPSCFSRLECSKSMRDIQTFHMSQDYGDIGYNFLVSGDGEIYVGRGWNIQGAHTFGYNSKSLGIAFIGNFVINDPTKRQIDAAKKLLELGVKENKLAKDYKLVGHCQVWNGDSPGRKLFSIIQKWDHWTDRP